MQKLRITTTIRHDLVERLDRLADLEDRSRSAELEALLELAIEEKEKRLEKLATPILGPIIESIISHPTILPAIAELIGEGLDPEEFAKWQEAGPRISRTRDRLRNDQGRRTDLRPEGS